MCNTPSSTRSGKAGCDPELYGPVGLPVFARSVEEAGFDAISFTERAAGSATAPTRSTSCPEPGCGTCAATSRRRSATRRVVGPLPAPLAQDRFAEDELTMREEPYGRFAACCFPLGAQAG
jgi:hypothetical protein